MRLISILVFLSMFLTANRVYCEETMPLNIDGVFNVIAFGAKGDGKTDDTSAIQAAMNAAAEKGGVVLIPPGKYLVEHSLKVPVGVHLVGSAKSPQYISPLIGSVILAKNGKDNENAEPLFTLGDSCSVSGITVFYHDQKPRDIRPYPWTFHLTGGDNTIENVTLINSYNGIKVGPESNVRHRIRSVYGCVLRRGIMVDGCTDIGRIENVQFHCHWWSASQVGGEWDPVFEYMWKNCEAFIFGRTDWEYVTNTFVFPVKIGYRFIGTSKGACNGQFSGIGADAAQRCIVVESIQYMGLLITNGQFVAFTGDNPIQIVVEPTASGSIRLVNCAFWGPSKQNIVSNGSVYLSLSDCFFSSGDGREPKKPLIEAYNGKLQINSCSFASLETSIALRKGLKHAIITGNNGANGIEIINEIGENAIIRDNEERPSK